MPSRRPPRSTAAQTYKALSRFAWGSAAFGALCVVGSWLTFTGTMLHFLAEIGVTLGGLMFIGSAGLALYWGRKSKRIGHDFGEHQVLRAIQQRGGKITTAELASKTGMPLIESEKWLKKLAKQGHAERHVAESGAILYIVPGFVPDNVTGRDFGERQVLLAIQQNGGKITAVELASQSGITIAESDKWLKKISDEGHAELEVTKKGTILYVVPGFVTEEDRKRSRGALNDPIDELEDILNQLDRDPKVPPQIPDLPERE